MLASDASAATADGFEKVVGSAGLGTGKDVEDAFSDSGGGT